MLMPAKTKFRKQFRGRMRGTAKGGTALNFGDFGLFAKEFGWVTANQIEAARVSITRSVKKGGKLWIRIFPDKPISKKPLEVKMGKGKGNPEQWVAVVKPGRVLFELTGLARPEAMEILRVAGHKFGLKTGIKER
jgi:large subunit ribosomal protein L16